MAHARDSARSYGHVTPLVPVPTIRFKRCTGQLGIAVRQFRMCRSMGSAAPFRTGTAQL